MLPQRTDHPPLGLDGDLNRIRFDVGDFHGSYSKSHHAVERDLAIGWSSNCWRRPRACGRTACESSRHVGTGKMPVPPSVPTRECAAMLIGFVSDERYVALPDVQMEFEANGKSIDTRSRASGAVYADIEPGPYRVTLAKSGYGSKRVQVEIAPTGRITSGCWPMGCWAMPGPSGCARASGPSFACTLSSPTRSICGATACTRNWPRRSAGSTSTGRWPRCKSRPTATTPKPACSGTRSATAAGNTRNT